MNPSPQLLFSLAVGATAYMVAVFAVDRWLQGAAQVRFRYLAITTTVVGFFLGMGSLADDHDKIVAISKAMLAIIAAGCVFYEQHRVGQRRPISERWKKFVGITLGIAAIIAYFNAFKFGYARYYHRWDQYHYYMGAKYFPEMGYDGLYKCSVIAQDELKVVSYVNEDQIASPQNPLEMSTALVHHDTKIQHLDMSQEVRHADKKIRNLGGDNLLMPVTAILEQPELCKSHFSPSRWEAYKADVAFFRIASDKTYWEDMQKDHGYNPPPVWTILGSYFGNFHAASTRYLQFLASLDILYLGAMFVAIAWAFGWRVFAVAAVLWGCQSPAPFLWTGGAFLRQDWLFFLVFAACLARKRFYTLAGASMVYAALLRIFPGLAVAGWVLVAGVTLVRHKTLTKPQLKMILGGTLAAALLIPLSVHVAGRTSYQQFYEHTLQVHDRTPLTNHMGLRVLIAQKLPFEIAKLNIGTGVASGRMKYTKEEKRTDPFETWKRMRNERYDRYKPVAYGIMGLITALFVYAVRRVKSLWVALCLSPIFMVLGAQLTCYYYSFIILLAPLTRVKRDLEAPIFGFAALSQFLFMVSYWNDDRYWVLTALELGVCLFVLWTFVPLEGRERVGALLARLRPSPAAKSKAP